MAPLGGPCGVEVPQICQNRLNINEVSQSFYLLAALIKVIIKYDVFSTFGIGSHERASVFSILGVTQINADLASHSLQEQSNLI